VAAGGCMHWLVALVAGGWPYLLLLLAATSQHLEAI
jgi:hypothetical protein